MISVQRFDRQGIDRFVQEWDRAFERGEYKAMAAVYDDYATLVSNDALPFVGQRAIEEFWREACAGVRARGIRRTIHIDQYDYCANAAYLQGTVNLTSDTGGITVVWFVTVWKRRQHDDRWRIVADISSVAGALDTRAVADWDHHAMGDP